MYYKWKAYDFNLKYHQGVINSENVGQYYHEGVMEADRFEMVVLELAKKNLVAKEVVSIDYEEYRRIKTIERRTNRKTAPPPPRRFTLPINPRYVLIAIVVCLLVLLAYLASPR